MQKLAVAGWLHVRVRTPPEGWPAAIGWTDWAGHQRRPHTKIEHLQSEWWVVPTLQTTNEVLAAWVAGAECPRRPGLAANPCPVAFNDRKPVSTSCSHGPCRRIDHG